MKHLKYIIVFLFITSIAYSQNVKITDFDLPVSSAKKFLINGFYNWNQTDPYADGDTLNISSSWNVGGAYNTFYSSPSYAWQVAVAGSLFQLNRQDTTRYRYDLAADLSKYFSDSHGYFVNGAVNSSFYRQNEFGQPNRPTIDVFGGFGYGRRVNATSIAKAIRIDEDLKKSGITSKFMPKSTMLAIAQIIDKESEYRDKYKALYESKIIEDINKEVMSSGVTNFSSLSALGFMRIRDVLYGTNQFLNERAWGGDVRLGISGQLLTRNEALELPAANIDLRGRYAYPIGLRHQIISFATVQTPMDSNIFKLYLGSAGLGYSFNLTNRISFNAAYAVTLNQIFLSTYDTLGAINGTIGTDKSAANNSVTAGFNFYIENYVTLNISSGFNNLWRNEQNFFTNASIGFVVF
ncbi:MAG TPA: hypothetical protein PKD83_03030 [Ignavibacteria bacterium]|nr:hypothetical protein [Ignavibacteria bacterium]